MTTTEIRQTEDLMGTLRDLVFKFDNSQRDVKNRFDDIRNGNLSRDRKPTKSLIAVRDARRDDIHMFFNNLDEHERVIFTVAWGNKNWQEKYEDLLNLKNDPQF